MGIVLFKKFVKKLRLENLLFYLINKGFRFYAFFLKSSNLTKSVNSTSKSFAIFIKLSKSG